MGAFLSHFRTDNNNWFTCKWFTTLWKHLNVISGFYFLSVSGNGKKQQLPLPWALPPPTMNYSDFPAKKKFLKPGDMITANISLPFRNNKNINKLGIWNSWTLYCDNNFKTSEKKSQIYFLQRKVTFVAAPCQMLSPQWSLAKQSYTAYLSYHSCKQANQTVPCLRFWNLSCFPLLTPTSLKPAQTGFALPFAVGKALWRSPSWRKV